MTDSKSKLINKQINSISNMLVIIWLKYLLAAIYKTYFKILSNQWLHNSVHSKEVDSSYELKINLDNLELKELDVLASSAGETYRGIGILLGGLGAAIILCALLPVGLQLSDDALLAVGVTKVALMLALFVILLLTRRLSLKQRWIDLRRTAEYKRYEKLRLLINVCETNHNVESFFNLRKEVSRFIGGGDECQIIYNKKKWDNFEGIEAFSIRLTYAAFSASLVGAALHLFIHASWLIFLTAYIPALIGAMHAVNSFLRLPQLLEQHGEMVLALTSLRNQLPADFSTLDSKNKYLLLSRQLIERLQNIDDRWLNIASQQDLHPV